MSEDVNTQKEQEGALIPVTVLPELTQYSTEMSLDQAKQLQAYNIDNSITTMFGLSPNQLAHAKNVANMYQIKHGLTATVPIICKSITCPYKEVCRVPPGDRVLGSMCPTEVGAMIARFESLCRELAVTDDDAVDMGLVKDVVDIEMQIIRADKKLAISGDLLADTILFVDAKGAEHHGEVVDPVVQLKLTLLDRKMKLLEKLNSTRKDKADEMKKKKDPTVKSANLMQRVKLIQQQVKQGMPGGQQTVREEQSVEIEVAETGINQEMEV